jgi:hypothetical protein
MKTTISSLSNLLESRLFRTAAILLAFFCVSVRGSAAVYNLQVPSNVPWFDTGINVGFGDQLLVSASGTVEYFYANHATTGPGGTNWDGVQFFSTDLLPDTTVVSLIGKIGGTTAAGTGALVTPGTPGNGFGYVGASYNQIVRVSGRLFLGFNDQYYYPGVDAYSDNIGSFNVTITVVPEPSAAAIAGFGALMLVRKLRGAKS